MANQPNDGTEMAEWEIIRRGDVGEENTQLTKLYEIVKPEEIVKQLERIVSNITKQGKRDNYNPDTDGPIDEKKKTELTAVLGKLKALCHKFGGYEAGAEFLDPAPSQHIYRYKTQVEGQAYKSDLKVYQDKAAWMFNGYPAAFLPEKPDLNRLNPFWSHIDLLALFFTKLGPAPQDATHLNFFLPLTALFVRWTNCLQAKNLKALTADELKDYKPSDFGPDTPPKATTATGIAARTPTMTQCTWVEAELGKGGLIPFELGASLGGFHTQLKTRAFGDDLGKARHKLLDRIVVLVDGKLERMEQDPDHPDKLKKVLCDWGYGTYKIGNAEFGNCAETYPFIQMLLSDNVYDKKKATGFAINNDCAKFTKDDVKYDETKLVSTKKVKDKIRHKYLTPPCGNCSLLLEHTEANESRFQPTAMFGLAEPSVG